MSKVKTGRKENCWKGFIEDIERANEKKFAKRYTPNIDYAVALPPSLRRRVRKIIHYEFDDFDKNVYTADLETKIALPNDEEDDDLTEDSDKIKRKQAKQKFKDDNFNESTCSDIERMQNEFPVFDLKVDQRVSVDQEKKKKATWFSSYLRKPRHERVIWNSKIYKTEVKFEDKPMEKQAEELMDAAAARFSAWFNGIGSNHDNDISPEEVKALFSIEGDRRLLASIANDPKEVKAVAQTVANKWGLPEMATELKYENYIKTHLDVEPEVVRPVAFGRTVPNKERPWVPSSFAKPVQTVFPSEIITGEKLFKGIGGLRTTKALANFYCDHPQYERPKYLVDTGLIKTEVSRISKENVPLYDLWKLKY